VLQKSTISGKGVRPAGTAQDAPHRTLARLGAKGGTGWKGGIPNLPGL